MRKLHASGESPKYRRHQEAHYDGWPPTAIGELGSLEPKRDAGDAGGGLSALLSGAMDLLTSAWDKSVTRTRVAVTDRRIITAQTSSFLEESTLGSDIPIDDVRYIRAATTEAKDGRVAIDLITRDENIRWLFPASIDNGQVRALAAVLAESMSIPDVERDELRRRHLIAIDAGTDAAAKVLTASE